MLEQAQVPLDAESDWVDRWACRLLESVVSKAGGRKAVKRGQIAVDGVVLEHPAVVRPGSWIARLEPRGGPPMVFELPLEVVHEDPIWAVVVKPSGFPVNGARHRTIEHALPFNLSPADAPDALQIPRPAHRLDGPTSGLLAVAKTAGALAELSRQFKVREVRKRYRAIAVGRLEGSGEVRTPLDDREAHTRWATVSHTPSLRTTWLTTVDLWPVTGRTHQLRRHLAELGHPILGDGAYGVDGWILRGKGLFLRAAELELTDPSTGGRRTLVCEEPAKFEALRRREARRWAKYHPEG